MPLREKNSNVNRSYPIQIKLSVCSGKMVIKRKNYNFCARSRKLAIKFTPNVRSILGKREKIHTHTETCVAKEFSKFLKQVANP